jgi:ribosomal protein S18 acetylase RimI-like enzyme
MVISGETTLGEGELSALGALRSECSSFDGVSSLELEKSLNAHRDMASFFLAFDGKDLVGALSIFAPMSDEAEIGALVLPRSRRRGAFSALLAEADAELCRFDYASELFVVDGRSESGKAAAASFGARYEYTEYAMRYGGGPTGPSGPKVPRAEGLSVARLGEESLGALVELRAEAFGGSREDAESFERATFADSARQVYGAFAGGILVGACSLGFEGGRVSINGLAIAEARRGRGLGQAFLAAIVSMLACGGYEVALDVNSENAKALHVYRKLGFEVQRSVEYHRRAIR